MRRSRLAVSVAVVAVAVSAPACSLQSNDGSADRRHPIATTVWLHRIAQICRWERPLARHLLREAARVRTFDDATAWVDEATDLSERVNAVFRRLPPPRDRTRERRRILELLRVQDDLGDDLRRAIHDGRGRAFFRLATRMAALDRKVAVVLDDLGVDACQPGGRSRLRERDLSA